MVASITGAALAPRLGLLLSGGLDSGILLGRLLQANHRVQPFYIRCGLVWQQEELRAIGHLLSHWSGPRLASLVTLDLPMADLYGDHWSINGGAVPDANSADDAVYLPGRNVLLLVKAALWCQQQGIEQLALGSLAGNPFADATEQFYRQFETVVRIATGGSVEIVAPLAHLSKQQVLKMGRHHPLAETFSCLAPSDGLHCGNCNKCAERQRGFKSLCLADPTEYASCTASA